MYKTLEEAYEAKIDLTERIMSMDAQLSQRAAEVSVGKVPDTVYKKYMDWKGKTVRAKAILTTKLQRTKRWINEHRKVDSAARAIKRGGSDGLLTDLYSLTKELVSNGSDISDDEQLLLDDVRSYLEERNV